nr:PfkB family carbohydrate kinase [Paenarthrobacter aurescens]
MRVSPGGTATNVARALQSLGWDAQLVGTVGTDPAGQFLRSELETEGVGVQHLRNDDDWTTPVVLQMEYRGDHVWRFRCPICATAFAKHRPTPHEIARTMVRDCATPDVFFFDRVSLFTLTLAEEWSRKGSFVVFEPATLGRVQLFDRAIKIAHMVKFSSERAPAFKERLSAESTATLVETLGADGAQVRLAGQQTWKHYAPQPVIDKVDSAGAGDWTTAGLLDQLVVSSGEEVTVNPESIARAVTNGQSLGALACSWEGVYPKEPVKLDGDDFERFACPRVIRESSNSEVEYLPQESRLTVSA